MIEMLQRHSSFRQSTMIYHRPHRGIFCTLAVCAALINSVISYHTTTVRSVNSVNNGQLVIPLPISQASAEEVVAAIQTHEIQQQLHKEQHNEFVGNHRTVRFAEEPDRHQQPRQHDIQQTPTPNEALQAPLPPQKSDLHPEAQTLYDIRGFHSPLTQSSNQAQRHHFQNNFHQPPHLQQQQQQQHQHQQQQQQEQHQQQPQQQQQNFLAPTSFRYFQDDNRNQQEHRVEPHQGHSPTPSPFHNSPLIVPSFFQPPAVFNNHQHAQPQQSQQQLYHQPQHSQENDFRPSQIDPSLNSVPAIQSTTESPVGFSPLHSTTQVPRSSQSKAYSSTVKPGSFVYVYEDVDYGDDLGNQNQNAQDNRLLQDSYQQSRDQERPSQIKTNQVTALIVDKPRLNGQRGITSDHPQYNYQEEEEPNIAFEPVRKDYNQLDGGRHHDNTFQNIFVPSFHSGPNVEIVPSSERKPPPDQSNAIPPVLAKPPVFKEPEKYPFTNDDYVLKSNPKQPEYIDVVESFEPYRPDINEEPRETTPPHHHNSRRKNQHHTRRPTHREPPTRPPQSTLVPYTTLRTTTYSTTTRPTRKHVTKTPSPFDSHNNYDDAAEQELIQKALQPAGTSDSKNDYHPVVLPAFPSQASRGVKPAGHRATTHREETTPFSRIPFTPLDDLSTTHEDDYEIFTSASPVVTKTFGRIKDFQNFDDVTPSTTPFSVRAGFNITPAQTFSDEQPVSVATPTRSRLPPFRPSFPVTTTTSTTSTTTSTAVPRINQKLGGAFRRKGPRPTKSTTRAPQIINEDSRQDLASVITPRLHSRPAIRVPTQPPTAIVEYHGNNEEDDRISVRNRGSHRENIIYSIDNDLEESPPVQRRPERVNSGSRINSRPRNHEAEGPRPKSHRPRQRNENTAGRNQQEPKSGKPLYYAGKMLQKEGGVYAGYKIPRYHVYGAPIPLIPGDLPFDHQPTKNGRKTVANTNVELPPLLPTTTREPDPSEDVSNQAEAPSRRGNTIKKLRIFTTDNDAPQKHERLHFRHQEDTNDPEEDTIPPTTRSRLAGKRKRPTVAAKIIEITTTNAPSERFVQPSTTERTHVRTALREDKKPKLEIEKPTAPLRRVHIRRRPNVRSFQKPKPSSPTTSTTNEPSIVASKPSPPRRLKPRQKSHRLRLHPSPPTESHTDDKQEEDQRETSVSEVTREYTPPPTENHSSVKPTEVPEKFSSRYREETAPFAVTRLPTITSRPRSSFTKPRTSRRPTSAPKTTVTPPAEDNIPPSVRLRPEDVIVKRKPARIIPPDSVSLRLKKKRNQLIGSRKKLSFSPSQSSESHEDDVGNSQKREVAGGFSDDNQTVRKEHRYQNLNKEKDIDSQETATILGLTTSEGPKTTTDWALDSFKPEYGTRAAISATLTTSLQDGDTTSEDSDQTKEGYDSTSTRAPAFRLGAGHLDPFSASYQPLSILSTDTQMPSLPLESIFPVLTNSTRG